MAFGKWRALYICASGRLSCIGIEDIVQYCTCTKSRNNTNILLQLGRAFRKYVVLCYHWLQSPISCAELSSSFGGISRSSQLNSCALKRHTSATIKTILITRNMQITNVSVIEVTMSSIKINPIADDRDKFVS